ncbi:hypothetical protein [Nocardia sp. NPDC059239]|uniref:hypothetical protein n=1 Tax=unclassified Nocardia TaxID=2637762 RepID=UPI0036C7F883
MRAAVELELNRLTEVTIELRTVFDAHLSREEIARLLATAQYGPRRRPRCGTRAGIRAPNTASTPRR